MSWQVPAENHNQWISSSWCCSIPPSHLEKGIWLVLSSKWVEAQRRNCSATLRAQGHLEEDRVNSQSQVAACWSQVSMFWVVFETCCIESGVVQEGMETEVGGRLGGGDGRWQAEPWQLTYAMQFHNVIICKKNLDDINKALIYGLSLIRNSLNFPTWPPSRPTSRSGKFQELWLKSQHLKSNWNISIIIKKNIINIADKKRSCSPCLLDGVWDIRLNWRTGQHCF